MRKSTANKIHTDIDAIEKLLDDEVAIWMADNNRMKKLTCWEYICRQLRK